MATASDCSNQLEKVPDSEQSSSPVNLEIGGSWFPYMGTTVAAGKTVADG